MKKTRTIILTFAGLVAAFSIWSGSPTEAAIITWNNTASGSWSAAANWLPNNVPGAGDTAIITNANVTVSLAGSTTVSTIILGTNGSGPVTLSLAGQTLTLDGPLIVNPSGSFTVDSGVLVGNANAVLSGTIGWSAGGLGGMLTLAAGSTLNLTTPNNHDMNGTVLTNNGTVVWNDGRIRVGSSATIYNNGLWDAQNDQIMADDFGGVAAFENYGMFRKSGGASEFNNSTTFGGGVAFNQLGGVLDVQNGTNGLQLQLQGGGNFTGGYITTNQSGLTVLSQGTFNLAGTVTGTNTWQNGGDLAGTEVINGGLTWVAGAWDLDTVTILSNSHILVVGTGNFDLNGTVMTNYGTFTWSNGRIRVGSSSTIYNYGLWDAQNDQIMADDFGGVAAFENYGTFRKSGGASEFNNATIFGGGVAFNQLGGVLDVQNSTNGLQLQFQGGGSLLGGFVTTNTQGLLNLSAGNFNLNGLVTDTNTWLTSANLAGTNVVHGALTWAGGNWDSATVTIATNSTVIGNAGFGVNLDMSSTIVTNNGTFTWMSGHFRTGNGTAVYNYGLWNALDDESYGNDFGNGSTIYNYGTFRKSGGNWNNGTGNDTIIGGGVVFDQLAGVIDVQNGTNGLVLSFQGGGNFTGGYNTTNTNGFTYFSAGNFTVNGMVTAPNTIENAGSLVGTNVVHGALTWAGGNWDSATVTIATNSTVIGNAGFGVNLDMSSTIVTNNGTFTWTSGHFRTGNGTAVYNYGLWNALDDEGYGYDFNNGSTFNNYGTFRKSGGAGEFTSYTTISVLFNQLAGAIDVQNGTNGLQVSFQGGGNFTGGYITTNTSGLTALANGSFNVNGTVTATNTWEVNVGSLVGTNVIQGALTWVGGLWDNVTVTIATNSTVIVNGGAGANMDMGSTIVTNNGTFTWMSGHFRTGNGTAVYNYGLWNALDDESYGNDFNNGSTFNNYGTFRKSSGVNNGSGTQIQGGITFNNSGKLDAQAGVINLQGAYSLTNGTLNVGLNSLTNFGQISLSGAASLVGTISANLNNGYIPIEGNSFTNLYYGSYTGEFTNTVLPFADAWTTNYFSTYYVMTVLNSRPILATLATNKFIVNELATLNVTNSATDLDIPAQTLVYSLASGLPGMTVNSATGAFTWTPQQTNSPSTNLVSVAVTDNGTPPLSATNTFTVIVKEINVPATLPTISTQIVNELTLLTVTNTATNSNIHATITGYALVSPPSNMVISASGIITWTPAQAQSPSTNLITTIVTNLDAFDLVHPNLTSTNTFTVVVKEINVPATLPTISTQLVNELTLLTVTNTATNSNIHATITGYHLVSPPSNMVISASGIITWTPAQAQSPSTNLITTIVTNLDAFDLVHPILTATNTFTVIVKELNVAPSLPTILTNIVNELTLLTVTNTATNSNIHATITGYALVSPPSNMVISASGIITWTPAQAQSPSTNLITTIVTNLDAFDLVHPTLTATNTFTVIVKEVNVAPVLPTILTNIVNELTLLTVTNTATNSNIHATITGYHLVSPPTNMVISASGIITWTPAQAQSPSTNLITTIVTNLDAFDLVNPILTATNTFTVIVKEVNVAPVLPTISTQSTTLLQLFSITNSAIEPNIHSLTGNYQLLVAPAGAAINGSGVITWTSALNQSLSTNTFTTVVTNSNPFDLINPHLSSTNTFSVIVVPNIVATNLTLLNSGGTNLTLSWPADHTGWRLEIQTNTLQIGLSTNWAIFTGSAATNQVVTPITKTNGAVFFRMIYP